jgi:hypothetical protein
LLHCLHDVLTQEALDQVEDASIADLARHLRQKPVVGDRVEGRGHRLPIAMIFRIR